MSRLDLLSMRVPFYTKKEEKINAISHGVGCLLSILILIIGTIKATRFDSKTAVVGMILYGISLILLYAVSCTYHALPSGYWKRFFRVLDHCMIFFLISGTYSAVLLGAVVNTSSTLGYALLLVVWSVSIIAIILNVIDLERFSKLSMFFYIILGWCIMVIAKPAFESISIGGMIWLILGGVAYTVGAVLYGIGKKKKYAHSVFHFFVLLGSMLQFITVYSFVL